jgi:hypothetical protein
LSFDVGGPVSCLGFTQDGKQLIAGGDGWAKIWSAEDSGDATATADTMVNPVDDAGTQ